MNYYISILFRAIPLLMGAICLTYGLYINSLGDKLGSGYIVASHVIIFFTAICIALFTTAATIIRQLINKYNSFFKFILPALGYLFAAISIIGGLYFALNDGGNSAYFVSGNIAFGVGLISCCVSTVALSSTKFLLIPSNSKNLKEGEKPESCFTKGFSNFLMAIPIICTIIGLLVSAYHLSDTKNTPSLVAGFVVFGISLVCGSLISLVASVSRQIQNTFTDKERWKWSILVLILGSINIILGICILLISKNQGLIAPSYVLIGLGLVCYSISSKVLLLASVWRRKSELAKRIPLIPVITALTCLFLGAYLSEAELVNISYFVPAHVMIGLGAICFTLFSIVSILESGTES
ncbi:DUF2776 domain-containing protein [Clostridium perfringens]|nr:DUF2776 domain-containing protein [Clostridium perfringens]